MIDARTGEEIDLATYTVRGERKRLLFFASFPDGFAQARMHPRRQAALNELLGLDLVEAFLRAGTKKHPTPDLRYRLTEIGRVVLARSGAMPENGNVSDEDHLPVTGAGHDSGEGVP
jgi:hypothetical protein